MAQRTVCHIEGIGTSPSDRKKWKLLHATVWLSPRDSVFGVEPSFWPHDSWTAKRNPAARVWFFHCCGPAITVRASPILSIKLLTLVAVWQMPYQNFASWIRVWRDYAWYLPAQSWFYTAPLSWSKPWTWDTSCVDFWVHCRRSRMVWLFSMDSNQIPRFLRPSWKNQEH